MNTTINILIEKEEDGLRFKIKHEGDVLNHEESVQAKYALHDYWYATSTYEQARKSTHKKRMTMTNTVRLAHTMIQEYQGKGSLVNKELARAVERMHC